MHNHRQRTRIGMHVGGWNLRRHPCLAADPRRRRPWLEEGQFFILVEGPEVRRLWRLGHVDGARRLFLIHAAKNIEPVRSGQLRDQRAHCLSRHAPQDFTGNIANGLRVIAVRRSRRPERRHSGEFRTSRLPVEPGLRRHFIGKAAEPRLMRQHLRDRDAFLPRSSEFRPVLRHRRVVIEASGGNFTRDQERNNSLAAGIDAGERIFRPRRLLGSVRITAANVGDQFAIADNGKTGAEFCSVLEILNERIADPIKTRRKGAAGARHPIIRPIRHP